MHLREGRGGGVVRGPVLRVAGHLSARAELHASEAGRRHRVAQRRHAARAGGPAERRVMPVEATPAAHQRAERVRWEARRLVVLRVRRDALRRR